MKTQHSGSALFLLELIIALLFFSLAGAVCIRMFSKADSLSSATVSENKAVLLSQQIAEEFYAGEGSPIESTEYFDRSWADLASENDASYMMKAVTSDDAENPVCSISVTKMSDGSVLYSLDVTCHRRKEASCPT